MRLSKKEKENLKSELVGCFKNEPEVQKVIIFGSFVSHNSPNDIDVAIFQNSKQPYLPLAIKYRRMARAVSSRIPIDILPIKAEAKGAMMEEILSGEVIYER